MCSFVEICKEAVLDKYGCSTRKHVEDGVCLPAMEEFLSRHVSRISYNMARRYVASLFRPTPEGA